MKRVPVPTREAALMAALLFIIQLSAFMSNASTNLAPDKKSSTFETPDFAFPENVEKDAMPYFKEAVSVKNGLDALKAAIQVVVARNLVSQSSFNDNAEMLDSAANALDAPYSQLFYLLEATLYRQLYQDNAWNYNQRLLPADSLSGDPLSWGRNQFCKKVLELTEKAVSADAFSKAMPIKYIAPLLVNSEQAEKCGLSVYDFLVYSSVKNLKAFGNDISDKVIPFRNIKSTDSSLPSQCSRKADSLLEGLYEYHNKKGNTAAEVVAAVEWAKNMEPGKQIAILNDLKDRLIHNEWDARPLHAYYQSVRYNSDVFTLAVQKQLYSQMNDWLKEFPDAYGSPVVKYDLDELSKKGVRIEVANVALPHTALKGKATFSNVNNAYVLIYKVPESLVTVNSVNMSKFPSGCSKVASVPIAVKGEIPFSEKCEFEIPGLAPGRYVMIPSQTSNLTAGWRDRLELWSVGAVNVTDIALISLTNSSEENSGMVYVVDSHNQKPIAGAQVIVYGNDGKKMVKSGKTDSEGGFVMPKGYYRVRVKNGQSSAEEWVGYSYRNQVDKAKAFANILTDLAIYKPGSEMQFALIGWTGASSNNSLLKNEKVDVYLRDANYNKVDSLTLTTDSDGRCNGKFSIPSSGMLGMYTLQAVFASYPDKTTGRTNVEVAEYKAPGFFVEIKTDSTQNYKVGDVLNFKGIVKTYSGMPVSDAKISFNVRWNPWWRYWTGSNSNASYGGELTTDMNGNFEISLPTDNLKNTEFEYGTYSVSVSATSPSGESQKAPDFRFSMGSGYSINPSIPEKICVDKDEVNFNVPVYDMLGLPSRQPVKYRLVNSEDKNVVFSGEFESPKLALPSDKLPSGKYEISFTLPTDTTQVTAATVLWRKGDFKSPYKTPLWIPETEIVANEGTSNVNVPVGSGYADSWILVVVTNEKGIESKKWIQINEENKNISVNAPENDGKIWVTFSGMHDFNQKVSTVTVIPENATRKLSVKAETFRDHISSGDKEQWKFKFSINDMAVGNVPAFAVMSDKSLNALSPFAWNFNVGRNFTRLTTSMTVSTAGNIFTSARFSKELRYVDIADPVPEWMTYGYNLGNSGRNYFGLRSTSATMIRGVQAKAATNCVAETEAADEMIYSVEEQAAPRYANMSMKKMESADAVAEEMPEPREAGTGGMSSKETELRPVEMPLAFFYPVLKSDADGEVVVDFETPNYNTTWQFQILGYTEDLLTAGLVKDAVASKQVMVRSNLPRYLRTGDKAQVTALVYNNSDKTIPLGGELIIFNPLTGEKLASQILKAEDTAPSANRLISLEWDVPTNLSAIGIRAYAYGESHSDGEQSVIPILPSSTPVIESTQFYIGIDKHNFSRKLPKFNKDANLTLKYCDNPIWECVLALPAISTPDSKNVLSLMKALYANSIASDIVAKYPEIKSGIQKVLSSDEESARNVLKSNLEKDANIKTVELNNTPWVNNASSETLRMRRLNTLLDPSGSTVAVRRLMEDIRNLQNPDGGWSWCPEMRSSAFISRNVLLRFGMMKKSGVLPSGIVPMIKKGIAYCDKDAYDNYVKSDHQFSTSDMLSYLYVRSFFDAGNGSSGFAGLKKKALEKISKEWEHFSIYEKSIAAILLSRSKGYEREAGVILESLNQFASKSDSKGWWFDNLSSGYGGWSKLSTTAAALEAYAEIEPMAPAVDGLRQWLVLQKETEDWGANANTVEVVQAILSSGLQWTCSNEPPVITLGDKRLSLPEGELLTGLITMSIDSKLASGKELKIGKSSSGPAWGGVVSQFVEPIKEVKPEKCENLKLEKKLLVITDTPAGEVASEGRFKVGDKIRVTLTLTCEKDMNYVALIDERGSCLEPVDQISGYTMKDGLGMYREVRDSKTSFFIDFLPKGVNVITYDCYADREGEYAIGMASVQSQYSPLQTAHSGGAIISVMSE